MAKNDNPIPEPENQPEKSDFWKQIVLAFNWDLAYTAEKSSKTVKINREREHQLNRKLQLKLQQLNREQQPDSPQLNQELQLELQQLEIKLQRELLELTHSKPKLKNVIPVSLVARHEAI